jgi:hypothetical protein
MAQKRFGPVRGAGVALIEKEGDKSIEASALGWVGYAGITEKGPTGELGLVTNKSQFILKYGSYIDDSLLPDAAFDYYGLANGAGGIAVVRVTDGNEVVAERTLYQRQVDSTESIAVPMGTIKAANGGRWGGKRDNYTNVVASAGDITATTLVTGITTFTKDQWKGGYITLSAVANTQYLITGNTTAGVISVEADQDMSTDHGGDADLRYYLELTNEEKEITYYIGDGEDLPDTEFSMTIYVDSELFKKYPNLNTNPTSARYWVSLINDDDANDQIEVVDLVDGSHTAVTRPANHYGVVGAITETVLTANLTNFAISSAGGGDPTFLLGTTSDTLLRQTITVTMTSETAGTVASDLYGDLGTITLGTLFDPTNAAGGALLNKWAPPFTVTAGATALAADDTLTIQYLPFEPDVLIGGYLYPDKVNAKLSKFRIVDNDHKTITVASGSDLTVDGAIDDQFLVEAPLSLANGKDGIPTTDAEFISQAWDTDSSPYNRLEGKNMGLVKFAMPGLTSTAIQKAGVAYAAAKNHQYRYEIPAATVSEISAVTYINDTLGRSDYAVVSFPSYGSVPDPDGGSEGKLKQISLTGMIHGREARIAADENGYHKAEAGLDATLPSLLKIPTGDAMLDHEILNPVGISLIKKLKGNFVIWGDRTVYTDSTWKFKHQRELLTYYEHVLQENFDWIVFAINDSKNDKVAIVALRSFFKPEWAKRALRGDTFEEACIIKIDDENNTTATRAAGDTNAEISLRLADTVERFNITIGKQGIFESTS